MLRTVNATRYVTPFREGGSLPALVEADDLGLYVLKFHGAGQGPLALAAEIIAGEIGRALGLKVPELVLMEVDAALGRNEPDYEIRELLRASTGLNMALDFLPGSVMFDPAAGDRAGEDLASAAVWFDAFVTNIDRTARNPNLLYWHKSIYFIDHGAALYFHHDWKDTARKGTLPIPRHPRPRPAAVGGPHSTGRSRSARAPQPRRARRNPRSGPRRLAPARARTRHPRRQARGVCGLLHGPARRRV